MKTARASRRISKSEAAHRGPSTTVVSEKTALPECMHQNSSDKSRRLSKRQPGRWRKSYERERYSPLSVAILRVQSALAWASRTMPVVPTVV